MKNENLFMSRGSRKVSKRALNAQHYCTVLCLCCSNDKVIVLSVRKLNADSYLKAAPTPDVWRKRKQKVKKHKGASWQRNCKADMERKRQREASTKENVIKTTQDQKFTQLLVCKYRFMLCKGYFLFVGLLTCFRRFEWKSLFECFCLVV